MTTCPSCNSNRIHRSRTRGFVEQLRRQFSAKRAFRCDACGWRGWGIETERPRAKANAHAEEAEPVDLEAIDLSLEKQGPEEPGSGGDVPRSHS